MLAAPRLTFPMLPNPMLWLPTSANPRLMTKLRFSAVPAENNPDSCWPALPMPDTAAGVISAVVLYNPDTPEPKFSTPECSDPTFA